METFNYQLNTLRPTTLAALANVIRELAPKDCPFNSVEIATLQDIRRKVVDAGVMNCGEDFYQIMRKQS